MIPGEKPIVMAERHQIEEFDEIANEFFSSVLGMDYDACFVSDESRLCDFSGCGMPDYLVASGNDLQTLSVAWDRWVICEVARRYGVDLSAATVTMVDLFNRIAVARAARVH